MTDRSWLEFDFVQPSGGIPRGAIDTVGMKERMDAIRLKQMLGAPLTSQELMCLQIEQNSTACRSQPRRDHG